MFKKLFDILFLSCVLCVRVNGVWVSRAHLFLFSREVTFWIDFQPHWHWRLSTVICVRSTYLENCILFACLSVHDVGFFATFMMEEEVLVLVIAMPKLVFVILLEFLVAETRLNHILLSNWMYISIQTWLELSIPPLKGCKFIITAYIVLHQLLHCASAPELCSSLILIVMFFVYPSHPILLFPSANKSCLLCQYEWAQRHSFWLH